MKEESLVFESSLSIEEVEKQFQNVDIFSTALEESAAMERGCMTGVHMEKKFMKKA